MTNLTEQWKKGKLEEYKRYYCKTVWFEDIFMARCHNKGQNDEWWTLENEKYSYNNVHHIKDIEVLAEVPSYEEYKQLLSDQLAKNEGEEINAELKELLKECKLAIFDYPPYDLASDKIRLQIKISQVLGEE